MQYACTRHLRDGSQHLLWDGSKHFLYLHEQIGRAKRLAEHFRCRGRLPELLFLVERLFVSKELYMGTSLVRKRTPLGPYRRPMLSVIGGS